MFMRENRRKNGVEQPERTAARSASGQRGAKKLSPNEPIEQGEDWRFTPDLSTCAAINEAHYGSGVSTNLYNTSYEASIPFVGNESVDLASTQGADRKLKPRSR